MRVRFRVDAITNADPVWGYLGHLRRKAELAFAVEACSLHVATPSVQTLEASPAVYRTRPVLSGYVGDGEPPGQARGVADRWPSDGVERMRSYVTMIATNSIRGLQQPNSRAIDVTTPRASYP